MDHQRILFDAPEGYLLLCVFAGLAYAYILYSAKHPWSKLLNRSLFAGRTLLVAFIAFLLMGPVVRQIHNLVDQPVFVFLVDDSGSVQESAGRKTTETIGGEIRDLQSQMEDRGFEVPVLNLAGTPIDTPRFEATGSDLSGALREIAGRYEGRRISGVLLVSDGIYNSGLSPLFSTYNFPVHTVGLGDTTIRKDIAIKNVLYNKIAYQGNQFPVRVEILPAAIGNRELTVSLFSDRKLVGQQRKRIESDQLVTYDFEPTADTQGIRKYDIKVEQVPDENNIRNNESSIFVEVVEGKKQIVIVASAPHPDIKAIRSVLEKNDNYECEVIIPGITELETKAMDPDLVIFHQIPELGGRSRSVMEKYFNSSASALFIVGRRSDVPALGRATSLLKVESVSRDVDEVSPVLNPAFSGFTLDEELVSMLSSFPPVIVPFGKISASAEATLFLYQRVGSVPTNKPLLLLQEGDRRKLGILMGEGIWRWRLDEFGKAESTKAFDELIGKLIQYMSTTDERKRFRSYPIRQEFNEFEQVVFESQVYNNIFEPVFGNTVEISIEVPGGKKSNYQYVLAPGNARYQIGGQAEGVYRYTASTDLDGKREVVQGQFIVVRKMLEMQNLTADFSLLRRLSAASGGRFFTAGETSARAEFLLTQEAHGRIHTEESYDSFINLRWIFLLLLFLGATEWFLRKWSGGY